MTPVGGLTDSRSATRPSRGERGFSLVEMMITASLFVVVTGAILGTFDSFTRAQQHQERSIEARDSLRQALDEVARALRGATSLMPDPSRGSDVVVLVVSNGSRNVKVRLRAEVEQGVLYRDGSKVRSRAVLTDLADPGGPVFTYVTASGDVLEPASVDVDTISRCTAIVRVHLATRTDQGQVSSSTDVQLRNRAQAAATC